MKKILLATVAALGLAGTASAADMAVKSPVVYAPVFTWTGCYLGINAGWIGSDESYETYRAGPFDNADDDPDAIKVTGSGSNLATQADFNLLRRTFSSDESGGTAGGQFGCQMQWGSVVLGGEWDWSWSGLEEDNSAAYGRISWLNTPVGQADYWRERTEHHHKQLDWFMTVRTRLGWAAWDRFLVYVTGGMALGAYDAYTQVIFPYAKDGFYNGGYREKRIGYTVGGGFEWAFANNWTAKAEFLYLDFGSFDYISPRETFGPGGDDDPYTWNTHVDAQEYVLRVGLNYLFHTGGAPVVARY